MGNWAEDKKAFLTAVFLLTLLTSMIAGARFVKAAGAGTITVPDDYPTIQAAVNAAEEGSTIFVKAGTYDENLTVEKSLSLVGENAGSTVVVGSGNVALLVRHDNVNVTGFTFRRPSTMRWFYGVHLLSVQHCNVFGKKLESTYYGVWLWNASWNNVFENTFTGDWNGICLQNSFSNNLSKNEISGSHDWGIIAQGTHDNLILDNYIAANGDGICLDGDKSNKGNLIAGNVVTQNVYNGIEISSSGSSGNQIIGNSVTANGDDAIDIGWDSNLVLGNLLTGNQGAGIYLGGAQKNNITRNLIENNARGAIRIHSYPYKVSLLNVIYQNNIDVAVVFSGSIQANYWDSESRGNYWSDYNGTDGDSDGVGDTPYLMNSSNVDNYPLMTPINIVANITEFLPAPTPQPTPSPSPSPTPTPTLSPSPTPSPTSTPSPSPTPTPSPSPSPSVSPSQSTSPKPTQTPEPPASDVLLQLAFAATGGAAVVVVVAVAFVLAKRKR